MSYTDDIPANELEEYEVIENWGTYFNDLLKLQSSDKTFQITKLIINDHINFSDWEFNHLVIFHNCYIKASITFDNCIFHKGLTLVNCSIDGDVYFLRDPVFGEEFSITSTRMKSFTVFRGVFAKCIFSFSTLKECNIEGGSFRDLLLRIEKGGMGTLIIQTKEITGNIIVAGLGNAVNKLLVAGISSDLILVIQDLKVNKIHIDGYRNEKSLRISSIESEGNDSEFVICKSYLGKTEFYLVNFSKFDLVSIVDSHIVESSFINITWPKNIKAVNGSISAKDSEPKISTVEHNLKLRETLRQLKHAMNKQGDIINEQNFHAKEMRIYYKTLNWKKDFWQWLTIGLSDLFSDFGQSILRPVLGLFTVHFFFFLILLFSGVFYPLRISFLNATWDGFWDGVHTYFRLINPLRKADDTLAGGWIIMDLLIRIWASYMIYNFIRASRRFIK